jgi:opacity protein-like surface antigen
MCHGGFSTVLDDGAVNEGKNRTGLHRGPCAGGAGRRAGAGAERGQLGNESRRVVHELDGRRFQRGHQGHFDSDTAFRAAFDYSYTDALQFGVSFGIGQRDYNAEIAGGGPNIGAVYDVEGDLDFMTFLVNGTYNFLSGPFKPFVTGGIGWSWVDTNIATQPPQTGCWWDPWYGYICTTWQDTKTLDGLTYSAGIGARYDFSDAFAVHASYRMDWIDFSEADGTPSFDGFELSVGWKF